MKRFLNRLKKSLDLVLRLKYALLNISNSGNLEKFIPLKDIISRFDIFNAEYIMSPYEVSIGTFYFVVLDFMKNLASLQNYQEFWIYIFENKLYSKINSNIIEREYNDKI